MTSIFKLFRPEPVLPELADQATIDSTYRYWRIRVFYSMYVGYALYYFTRKSFTFAMPSMIQDLGLGKGEVGVLASILSITYGISKFVSGIMGDKSNPRYFMSIGLIITGICNILFGLSSSIYCFALFWGLNGWFQGFGWPACARLLTHWYSQSERGRWWSMWNTCHNVGGAVIPLFTAFFAQYWGWRSGMYFPGVICILGGFFLMNRLCDTPQSKGLPPVEKFKNDYPTKRHEEHERELTVREILVEHVLRNPFIWVLAFSYFFVYIIRTAVNDWTVLYLVESKGYTQLGAGGVVFWFEIGGIFGSLAAGWLSDTIFSGRRGPVNVLYCLAISLVITLFWLYSGSSPYMDSVMLFAIGFLIFGPQMMIGMAAAELSHKKAAATATGFTGWVSYIGAAFAGYPLGKITQEFGWEGFFITLAICAVVSTLLLFPLWNVKSPEDSFLRRRSA